MKKFLFNVCCLSIIWILFSLGGRALLIYSSSVWLQKNVIPEHKTTLVLGNSTAAYIFNDTILPNYENVADQGFTNSEAYNCLKYAIEYNKTRIDTVILEIGAPQLYAVNDSYLNSMNYIDRFEKFSVFDHIGFIKQHYTNYEYLVQILTSIPIEILSQRDIRGHGYYVSGIDSYSEKVKKFKGYKKQESFIAGDDKNISELDIYEKCNNQIAYLKKISDYCIDKNLTLIIFNPPVDTSLISEPHVAYKKVLQKILPPKTLIADYYNFKFSNKDCLSDVLHVTYLGSMELCNSIKNCGLKLMTIEEYCSD